LKRHTSLVILEEALAFIEGTARPAIFPGAKLKLVG
jgi:hypothetical protein